MTVGETFTARGAAGVEALVIAPLTLQEGPGIDKKPGRAGIFYPVIRRVAVMQTTSRRSPLSRSPRSIFCAIHATIPPVNTPEIPPRSRTARTDPRSRAVAILARVNADGTFVSHELSRELADGGLGEHERNLLQKLVKGVIENRAYLDSVLSPYLSKGLDSLPSKVREALRLGAYQILFLDRIHAGTAVNASVDITKQLAGPKLGNVVNAVLRRLLREGVPPVAGETPLQRIAREQSHPEWLVSHWIEALGEGEAEELCRFNNSTWRLFIRVNTLRATPAECWAQLAAEGVAVSPGTWCADVGVIDRLPPGRKLDELESFKRGLFVVHDESSALIARLVDPRPGETVLDVCAAPGGKTVHLAALMRNNGRIVACDRSALRLRLVEEACRRLGVSIVETHCGAGDRLGLDLLADRVLVDAPCSGLGVIGRRPDIRWHRKPEKFAEFHALQGAILRGAAERVKPGGRLVYSTCTTAQAENEATVAVFLAEFPDFRVVPVTADIVPAPVVTREGFLRTWPQRHKMGGAFGVVMERSPRGS